MKNLLFIFPLLAVLSTQVLASNEIVPEDNSAAGAVTDITIESAATSEDSHGDTMADKDKQKDDYEKELKKMDEEMKKLNEEMMKNK